MIERFDTMKQPFDDHAMLLLPLAALLVAGLLALWRRSRRPLWWGGALTLVLFLLCFVLPLADHHHMRALAAGPGVRTAEGPISGYRRESRRVWLGRSRGVGVTSSDSYRTRTDEQFLVGDQGFAYEVGGFPSNASFTNVEGRALPDGGWASVRYVADPWYGDTLRIVRLSLGEPDRSVDLADRDFAAFWRGFAAAVARGDRAAAQAMTRFPFLFAGTPLEAAQFGRVWDALFAPAPLRQCLGRARPVAEQGGFSVSCGVYVYWFEKGTDGWRFATFAADPEA